MPRTLLDGSDLAVPRAATTWGDLVGHLDTQLEGQGRIVTDVRFDGLDEAAFRDPAVLARPLEDYAVVEVMTGTPASLVERTLDEAGLALADLTRGVAAVAGLCRQKRVAEARQGVSEIAGGLSEFVGVIGATALGLHVDLGALPVGGTTVSTMIDALGARVEAIAAAQHASDWDTAARLLDDDLRPSLSRWQDVLAALAAQAVSSPPRSAERL